LKETVTRVLASLTPREERVLRMRFGIGMNTDHTLEEVGQQFSVTRERIRQIEAKALRKLKHPSRSRKLRSFESCRAYQPSRLLCVGLRRPSRRLGRRGPLGRAGHARDAYRRQAVAIDGGEYRGQRIARPGL